MATGKQSPDNYFLIVDSYIISVCGNAVYVLNVLFCAHWAFSVDYFPRLQRFYKFLEVIYLAKKNECSILSLLSALDAKNVGCIFTAGLFCDVFDVSLFEFCATNK